MWNFFWPEYERIIDSKSGTYIYTPKIYLNYRLNNNNGKKGELVEIYDENDTMIGITRVKNNTDISDLINLIKNNDFWYYVVWLSEIYWHEWIKNWELTFAANQNEQLVLERDKELKRSQPNLFNWQSVTELDINDNQQIYTLTNEDYQTIFRLGKNNWIQM